MNEREDEINKRENIFNSFLQMVYKHPLKVINRKCTRKGYMDIARKLFVEEKYGLLESFERVMDIIEQDYKKGSLKYNHYWRLKRFYRELAEKAKDFEKRYSDSSPDKEQLLVRFLWAIYTMDNVPKEMKASEVANLIGVDINTTKEFLKWLTSSKYNDLARFIARAKKLEPILKQHSGSE